MSNENDPFGKVLRHSVSPKVVAGGAATAVATVVLYILQRVPGIGDLPTVVEGAVTTIIVTAIMVAVSHFKHDPDRNG